MKTNVPVRAFTKEGAPAFVGNAEQQLRRSVLACMLWEDNAYDDGKTVANRITALVPKVGFEVAAKIAIEAREEQKLRHAPLLILNAIVKNYNGKQVGDVIARVIQRPDEMGELISLYWAANGKKMLPRQMKIGIARAFKGFNEYQLAKWNSGNAAVKLRDVAFLTRVRAGDNAVKAGLIARLVNKSFVPATTKTGQPVGERYVFPEFWMPGLASPETWENRLSRGENKKTVFTEMLQDKSLGPLALLRNIRNMEQAGVDGGLICSSLKNLKADRVLPFRFITAARVSPRYEPELEALMLKCVAGMPMLPGKTALLVDVSDSMNRVLSVKSEVTRMDCALGLAILLREVCENVEVHSFSNDDVLVPARRGFALRDAIRTSQRHAGTYLGRSLETVRGKTKGITRTIVITDEQAGDIVGKPMGKGYMINVSSEQRGVGYGDWTRITGWSESVVGFIQQLEAGYGGNSYE